MKSEWGRTIDKRNIQVAKWVWLWLLIGLGLSVPVCCYVAIWGPGDGGQWGWTAAANVLSGVLLFLCGGALLDGVGAFDKEDKP